MFGLQEFTQNLEFRVVHTDVNLSEKILHKQLASNPIYKTQMLQTTTVRNSWRHQKQSQQEDGPITHPILHHRKLDGTDPQLRSNHQRAAISLEKPPSSRNVQKLISPILVNSSLFLITFYFTPCNFHYVN